MLDAPESIAASCEQWLARLEHALAERDHGALEALFHADSHWRDVLALTWSIDTISGRDAVVRELATHAARAPPTGFRLDHGRTPPRQVMRAGTDAIEAIFTFETNEGVGSGVLRLTPDSGNGGALKAWTLLTALEELKGFEETIGRARPTGQSYSRDFRGPNWLDLRKEAAAYADRDPTVLVVGGGQAGLSIAARLTQLGVDTLIVDREQRIGDNWRNRYHALTLHNQVHVNHLPYMPFPPSWPTYIPKDKLAAWFEAYVESLELNYWTASELEGATYDEKSGRWIGRAAPGRHQANDAPAARRDGHRRQRYPQSSRHPDLAELPRQGRCTRANTSTARTGKAPVRWSSAPATAATTSRRICIRAGRR